MVNLLSGGKTVNSGVKFINFYLIIEGSLNPEINIAASFKTFITYLKSKFTVGKGGDSPFKVLADGSYVNAFTSIADSFKFIEEGISASGVSDFSAGTASGDLRADTALSGNSKKSGKGKAKNPPPELMDKGSM